MRRLLILGALVVGVLTPAAGALSSATTAAADELTGVGIRLVDAPIATRDDPRARAYIIDHVAPGTAISRRVEISNDSGEPAHIAVYAAGAEITAGSFTGLEGETPDELSTWTSVSRGTLDLAQGAKQMVQVSIDVPADAAPGERYATVWAQTTSAAHEASGVKQVSRVGIRIYLSVGPGGVPAAALQIESMTPARDATGTPIVRADLHNTGGRALDLSGTLILTDGPGSLSAGPFPIPLGTTLGIGQTRPISIELHKQLPKGPWKARITVTSGLLTETAQATLTFPDSGTGHPVAAASGEDSHWWWWAGGTALGLGLLILLGRQLRRQRRARPELPPMVVTDAAS